MSYRSPLRNARLNILVPEQPDRTLGLNLVLVPGPGCPDPKDWSFVSSSWLNATVPRDVGLRISSFTHQIEFDNTLKWQSFHDEANNLLLCLDSQLSTPDAASNWPIILIAHSLGGFIVKQALQLASFNKYQYGKTLGSISGIVLLGTPHCQNDTRAVRDLLDTIIVCLTRETISKSTLSKWYDDVSQWCEAAPDFRETVRNIDVLSCYERLTTKSQTSRSFRKSREILVVNQGAAKIGARDEMLLELPSDHSGLPVIEINILLANAALTTWMKNMVASSMDRLAQKLRLIEIASESSLSESNLSSLNSRREPFRSSSSREKPPTLISSSSLATDDLDLISRTESLVVERKLAKLPCFMLQTLDRNGNFQGREDVLRSMDDVLLPRYAENDADDDPMEARCITLHGPPGIGKTEIAVEYAYTRRNKFDAIFWIHADDIEKIEADFAQITIALELESGDGPRNPIVSRDIAKEWLSKPVKDLATSTEAAWLIVFDNADDPDLLADYVQNLGNGALLVTTRDPDAKDLFPSSTIDIPVDSLSREEGAALLENLTTSARRKPDQSRSVEISDQLGGFPLAITQMAFYIRNKRLNYSEFLETYEDTSVHRKLHDQTPSQQRKTARGSIASIWAFDELDPDAQYLLEILTFMDPDCVQESLFLDQRSLAKLSKVPGSLLKKSIVVYEARGQLISSSLIRKNDELRTWRVHRLLQDTVLGRLLDRPQQLIQRFQMAVTAVLAAWPETSPDKLHAIKNWKICKSIYPHVLSLRDRYEAYVKDLDCRQSVSFATLLNRAAWWQYERGDSRALEPLAQLALRVCQNSDVNQETDGNLLSDIYYTLGARGTEANDGTSSLRYNKLFMDTRLQISQTSGKNDDRLGKAYNQYGISKLMQGDIEQSITLFLKALDIYRPLNDQQLLAMPTANLGLAYWLQGPEKYELAVSILEQGLREREELHGPDDTESFRTGRLLYAMGNVKESQGHLEESEMFHRRALKQYQSTIGDDHHRTSDVRHRVARHCLRKKDLKACRELITQALKVWNADKSVYRNEIARTTYLKSQLLKRMKDSKAESEASDMATKIYAELRPGKLQKAGPPTESDYDDLVCFWSR